MSDIVMSANGLVAREADTAYLRFSGSRRGRGVRCLFEAGCLLTFSTFRMGAYLRWGLIIGGWVSIRINTVSLEPLLILRLKDRGTQRQFSENICSEDDLRSRIFGTFVVKFLACLPLLGFSNI